MLEAPKRARTREASSLDYRRDVDGLRAWAVIPVILFHFGVTGLDGGFVGVDAFFVISGYLITKLVMTERENGDFSFIRFYERRARRLFPALFATVVVTLPLSVMFLSSRDAQDAMGAAIFSVTSLSNFFFWQTSGYFEAAALTKPLLHTWSLSVEEQFYLVWPGLVVAVLLAKPRLLPGLIMVAGVISFLACLLVYRTDADAAFYLMPFRIFEFSIGAGVIWLERVKLSRLMQELTLIAGLSLLLGSILLIDESTVFPGWAALCPCLGTALCIIAGRASYAGAALANPVCVWIGRFSYSAYLAHWPLIVFFDAITFRTPEVHEQMLLILATFAIAALSYYLIEMPIRRPKRKYLGAASFGLVCAMLALCVTLLSSIFWANGIERSYAALSRVQTVLSSVAQALVPAAMADEIRVLSSSEIEVATRARSTFARQLGCRPAMVLCGEPLHGAVNVLIIGDSHAADAMNAIWTAWPEANVMLSRVQGCPPFATSRDESRCEDGRAEQAAALEAVQGVDVVVLNIRLTPQRAEPFANYLSYASSLAPRLIVFGAGPLYERDPVAIYERLANPEAPRPALARFHDLSPFEADEQVEAATAALGGIFIDRETYFCPDGTCRDYTLDGTMLITADRHHLSWPAAVELGVWLRRSWPDLLVVE